MNVVLDGGGVTTSTTSVVDVAAGIVSILWTMKYEGYPINHQDAPETKAVTTA